MEWTMCSSDRIIHESEDDDDNNGKRDAALPSARRLDNINFRQKGSFCVNAFAYISSLILALTV